MLTSKLWFLMVLYCIKVWVHAMTAPNRRGYRFQQPEAKEGAYDDHSNEPKFLFS